MLGKTVGRLVLDVQGVKFSLYFLKLGFCFAPLFCLGGWPFSASLSSPSLLTLSESLGGDVGPYEPPLSFHRSASIGRFLLHFASVVH